MAQQRMQTTLKKTERHLQIKINSKSLHKFVSYFDRVQLIWKLNSKGTDNINYFPLCTMLGGRCSLKQQLLHISSI